MSRSNEIELSNIRKATHIEIILSECINITNVGEVFRNKNKKR